MLDLVEVEFCLRVMNVSVVKFHTALGQQTTLFQLTTRAILREKQVLQRLLWISTILVAIYSMLATNTKGKAGHWMPVYLEVSYTTA